MRGLVAGGLRGQVRDHVDACEQRGGDAAAEIALDVFDARDAACAPTACGAPRRARASRVAQLLEHGAGRGSPSRR